MTLVNGLVVGRVYVYRCGSGVRLYCVLGSGCCDRCVKVVCLSCGCVDCLDFSLLVEYGGGDGYELCMR